MPLVVLGSGVQYETSTTGSGTGNYNSFLRLQANREEEGFNTDDGGEADNKDGVWTHSLRVSDLVAVEYNGVWYYEIRLDLNEGNAGDQTRTPISRFTRASAVRTAALRSGAHLQIIRATAHPRSR
jgi:hypothetical protein